MVARTGLLMLVVALAAAAAGYFVAAKLASDGRTTGPVQPSIDSAALAEVDAESLIGQPRPDFTLSDTEGREVSVSDFDRHLVLINFWATWCAPCVEEMPMLTELQAQYGDRKFQVIGIAIDDPQKAADFAADLGVGYPVLVGLADTVLAGRQYGNRAGMLPYSVLVDSDQIVRWTHLGALVREELEAQIEALL